MGGVGTGATGQPSLVWALTSAPLTWDYERRHAGHWYIHHPMHLQVFCSRCAWQMAGPKFGVQMMDSEYCSKTGERLQHCRTAAWRMGAGDLSLLRPCFPSFVCQNRLNRSWFQIAIVIFKSGSDLVHEPWESLEFGLDLNPNQHHQSQAEIAGSGAKPFLSCFSNAFRIPLSADADYNHYLAPSAPKQRSAESDLSASWSCRHVHKPLLRFEIREETVTAWS